MNDFSRYSLTLFIGAASLGSPACQGDSVEPLPAAVSGLTASTPMSTARALHTATRLRDGRVLLVGGGASANAELFDPASQTYETIPASAGRQGHTATLLPNGSVLIVGGGWGTSPSARTADLFDPATKSFRPTGAPIEPRSDHAAVLLRSGKVLILGGDISGVGATPTATAELYDPGSSRFVRTGSMAAPRRPYGVTLTPDGSVLVPGGTTTGKHVIADTEIYDAAAGTFARTGSMRSTREKHTAAQLRDGTILVIGGSDSGRDLLASSEIFDPRTGKFSAGPALHVARHKIVSASLPDGSVLVAGGTELAELYDAATGRFTRIAGASNTERLFPAVATLGDDRVMISGGYSGSGTHASAWIFRP